MSVVNLDSPEFVDFENYLLFELYSQIPENTCPENLLENEGCKMSDSTAMQNDILKLNNQDGIPPRSPNRVIGKKYMPIPNSPEMILDSSSVEYHSYGSDRSSEASIFSDNEDPEVNNDKNDIINLDGDDDEHNYKDILELLDYLNADEVEMVQNIDEIVTIVAIHSGIEPKKVGEKSC